MVQITILFIFCHDSRRIPPRVPRYFEADQVSLTDARLMMMTAVQAEKHTRGPNPCHLDGVAAPRRPVLGTRAARPVQRSLLVVRNPSAHNTFHASPATVPINMRTQSLMRRVTWRGVTWCGVTWRGVTWCGVAWRGRGAG